MYKTLKWIRVTLSLLILIILTLNFFYFSNTSPNFSAVLLKFQFVPSMLGILTGSAIFFIILIILTILFGRVYCSTLCPVGTFQDIVSRFASLFKSKKNRRYKYSKGYDWLRYSILALVMLPLIGGLTLPISLLDPYSNWGRISSQLFAMGEQAVNNVIASIFPNTFYVNNYSHYTFAALLAAIVFLSVIICFSAVRGRLYCNTICPVGSILGGLSKFALFKPQINDNCNQCMLCISKCKSQCIDVKNHKIDESRCVACLDCMQGCNRNAIGYRFAFKKVENKSCEEVKNVDSQGRRRAILTLGLLGSVVAVRASKIGPVVRSKAEKNAIAPPGAISFDNLKNHCTTCHACISACPSQIIKPAFLEYGLEGFMMPVLSFKDHFCTYECNKCSQVCPNGALLPLSIEEKKICQIGKAKYSLKECIVYRDRTDCGACDEHCPTNAITMIPFKDTGLYIPKLDRNVCVGCGACEYICPASPVKAIIVIGNEEHQIAKEAVKEEKKEVKIDEFGF